MWFVFLGLALVILVVGGIYFVRRVCNTLQYFGAPEVIVTSVRWSLRWLLFAFPLLLIGIIAFTLLTGGKDFGLDNEWLMWGMAVPFFVTLVVLLQSLPFFLLTDLVSVPQKWRKRVDRARPMVVGLVTAFFFIYTPARILADKGTLEVRHYSVGKKTQERPLKIAFLADLQLDNAVPESRGMEAALAVNKEKPDLVFVGGDWVNSGSRYVDASARVAGKLKGVEQTVSVFGDHDNFIFLDRERSRKLISEALAKNNVAMLDNQVRFYKHQGKSVGVVFLTYNYIEKATDAQVNSLVESVMSADYKIVVTHQMNDWLAARLKNRVNLVLSAHTHGGQVNPVVFFKHFQLARIETRYVSGGYDLGSTKVIVTSGVGFSTAPFRYASPATVEIVDVSL